MTQAIAAHKGAASNGAGTAAAPSSPADGKAAPGVKGDSKLRRGAVAFEWKDVTITPPTSVTARDAVYELGSVLEATALWKMARAAQLCAGPRQGTPSESVSQARGSILARPDAVPLILLRDTPDVMQMAAGGVHQESCARCFLTSSTGTPDLDGARSGLQDAAGRSRDV